LGSTRVDSAGDSGRTVGQVESYWTPKRMANATPLGVLKVAEPQGGGTGGSSITPVFQSTQLNFNSFNVADPTQFPYDAHGKVFFTGLNDQFQVTNFACSGTAVDSPNLSTVITAGHCVHSHGVWSTNFAFVPGYHRDPPDTGPTVSPYGVWAASDLSSPSGWVSTSDAFNQPNFKYDVGAAVVARNSSGQTLEDVIGGGRGIMFNQPTAQPFHAFGYPVGGTTNHPEWGTSHGAFLAESDSDPAVTDNGNHASPGPNTLGIGSDMTGGSSGGGWVIFDGSGNGFVNGLNSYKYTSPPQPDMMYGPYFGDDIEALYNGAGVHDPGTTASPAAGDSTAGVPRSTSLHKVCKKRKRHTRKKKRVCRLV